MTLAGNEITGKALGRRRASVHIGPEERAGDRNVAREQTEPMAWGARKGLQDHGNERQSKIRGPPRLWAGPSGKSQPISIAPEYPKTMILKIALLTIAAVRVCFLIGDLRRRDSTLRFQYAVTTASYRKQPLKFWAIVILNVLLIVLVLWWALFAP
jgi:hypothetical protein